MPDYTPVYKLRQPRRNELVTYGAVTITENMDKIEAALLDSKWYKGNLTSGTDLNSLTTNGTYRVTTYAVSQSLINAPDGMNRATIEVLPIDNTDKVQRITLVDGFAGSRVYIRASNQGKWPEQWANISRVSIGIPTGADLNDYTNPGVYDAANSTIAASIAHLNESNACHITVDKSASSSFWTVFQTVRVANVGTVKMRTINSAGVISEWRELTPTSDAAAGGGLSYGKPSAQLRKLGGFGTAGKPVVALTLDHGLNNLTEHLADHADSLGVPYTIAVSTGEVGEGENSNVSWSDLQNLALNAGVELANHGPSHANQVGPEAITAAVVGSRDTMTENMPQIAVDSFIMPGHGVEDGWDGLGVATSIEAVNTSFAGQLIQRTHGVFTGDVKGTLWPLNGDMPAGVDRVGIDTDSWVSETQSRIEQAITLGGYSVLTIGHPAYWGNTDRTTVARMLDFVDWLAARRDAGDLILTTVAGAAFARAYDSHVPRLDDPDGWASGSQTISLSLVPKVRGGVFQAEAAGATSITVTDDTGTLNSTVAGQYRPFTIPADATSITVTHDGGTDPIVRPI